MRALNFLSRVLRNPRKGVDIAVGVFLLWRRSGMEGIRTRIRQKMENYELWYRKYSTLQDPDRELIRTKIASSTNPPKISILMPVYNIQDRYLKKALDSVLGQLYPHWELCIADDCSTMPSVRKTLEDYARRDPRIKVVYREKNGHIAEASNSALALVTGQFVGFVDQDDELPEEALFYIAEELERHPDANLIYTDQDRINDVGGLSEPLFKPDWNPDYFHSMNYLNHLCVYRTILVKELGGLRKGYEGSQDYDLALRVIDRIPESTIRHIPRVLYHWRAIRGSVALDPAMKSYAHENARRALREHFERVGKTVRIEKGFAEYHRVVYPLPENPPLVSLIIGTRDRVQLLKGAVEGILHRTDYPALEVLIIDNQSVEPETLAYFKTLSQDPRVRIIRYDAPFNFSAINNFGVRHANGTVIGLINNDLEVISPGWLSEMVAQSLRPEVGAVGAKLYYADETLQHAGCIVGIGKVAGHAFKRRPRDFPGYMSRAVVVNNFSVVTAACLLMRKAVFEEVGGLDEKNLAVAFNDVDLCLKIRAKGYWVVYTPYAELYHLESASRGPDTTPETYPRFLRERDFMVAKWGEKLLNDPSYSPNLTLETEDFAIAFPPRTLQEAQP
ncbi:MAG: glycosyltransferase [Bdellovibrionota bacterium]